MAFHSDEKATVRDLAKEHVRILSEKANRRLSYFGMPSASMTDVAHWKDHISQVFAFERDKKYISHLVNRSASLGFLNHTRYFWGDIDEVVQREMDNHGRQLAGVYPVDIINLDYCDALDYRGFEKLETVQILLERQKNALLLRKHSGQFPYFLLFLTYNLPKNEADPSSKQKYMEYLHNRTQHYSDEVKIEIGRVMDWYQSDECPTAYIHKCFVIDKIIDFGRLQGFRVKPKAAIRYFGDHEAAMMHYQIEVRISGDLNSPVPTKNVMDPVDVMNFSVIDASDKDIYPERPKVYRGR